MVLVVFMMFECFILGNVLLFFFFMLMFYYLLVLYEFRNMFLGLRLMIILILGNIFFFDFKVDLFLDVFKR